MLYNGDNVYTAGLTGMSGAGKTTACRVFAENGFTVIDCDKVARKVVEPGTPALNDIATYFSDEILLPDGSLNRKKLGGIVFSDREKLDALNSLIYPYITFDIIERITEISRSGKIYVLLDAPTLFESGADVLCDTIVSVTADIESCVGRIMMRDGLTREQAELRLSSQHDRSFYIQRSDFCADNSGTQEELIKALNDIIGKIKKVSSGE